MITYPVNVQYTSYFWLIDKDGNPVTGAAGSITCTVMDEADGLFSSPAVSEVDSTNAPGLYKASFTPDAVGFWKVQCDSTQTNADIAGGEVIYVADAGYDEKGTYAYPIADATLKEISEQFTTAWSTLTRRRTHMATQFDFSAIAGDANTPNVTIIRSIKVDGAVWKQVDQTTIPNATLAADPVVLVEALTTKEPYKIEIQLSVGMAAGQDLDWAVVVKYEDRNA